jgi:hypothetical protein
MLRTIAQLRAGESLELAGQLHKLGTPTGPWRTAELAKADLNDWAWNRGVAGGGWSTSFSGLKAAVPGPHGRGQLKTLVCHCHGTKGKDCTDCKWSITLEECVEGWAIRSYHPHHATDTGHNHSLSQTAVESAARSTMRTIPPDLVELGKSMVAFGMSPAHVFRYLKAQAEKNCDEVLFTYMDVYHACGASTNDRRMDATNFVGHLKDREVQQGLFQRTTTDSEGCLKEVFFQMAGSTAMYGIEPEHQVVEIDHKVRLSLFS